MRLIAFLAAALLAGPAVAQSSNPTPPATTTVMGKVKPGTGCSITTPGVLDCGGGGPGTGTLNAVPFWNTTTTLGSSAISDDGASVTIVEPTTVNAPTTTLGSELLSNPTFVANATGWTLGSADTVWSSGQFVTTCSCADETLKASIATVSGHTYVVHLAFTITGDQNYITFANNSASSGPHGNGFGPTQDFVFLADFTGTDTIIFDFYNQTPGAVRTITSPISVREITPLSPLNVSANSYSTVISINQANGSVVLNGSYLGSTPGPSGAIQGSDAVAGGEWGGGLYIVGGKGAPDASGTNTGSGGVIISGGSVTSAKDNGAAVLISSSAGIGSGASDGYVLIQAPNHAGTSGGGNVQINGTAGITLQTSGGSPVFFQGAPPSIGTNALTLSSGQIGLATISDPSTTPGAAGGKIYLVCSAASGKGKIVVSFGTDATPVTIVDNVGTGGTGC